MLHHIASYQVLLISNPLPVPCRNSILYDGIVSHLLCVSPNNADNIPLFSYIDAILIFPFYVLIHMSVLNPHTELDLHISYESSS